MLPLFLPNGVSLDKLMRAIVGLSLFASAYMAEAVRGGLQAVAKGQTEAARALGLKPSGQGGGGGGEADQQQTALHGGFSG